MLRKIYYKKSLLPLCLLAPQLMITLLFFIWPSLLALKQSLFRGDAFGIQQAFVGFANFVELFTDAQYLQATLLTVVFSISVAVLCLVSGLLMAVLVNRILIARGVYKILLILPYAVAPAVAAILWRFLFHPSIGTLGHLFNDFGLDWNYYLHAYQAMFVVVVTSAWQQFSYNFLFFLAALQAVPKSFYEAAALDGAGFWQRFYHITLPLLSPITFFLFVINLTFAFFDSFGVIHVMTQGGPAEATNILVYKVYKDGFMGLDLGSSNAQSVILMLVVVGLTIIQFKYIEKKVHYS